MKVINYSLDPLKPGCNYPRSIESDVVFTYLPTPMQGWLPQFVVDRTASLGLLGAYQHLQVYAREQRALRGSEAKYF